MPVPPQLFGSNCFSCATRVAIVALAFASAVLVFASAALALAICASTYVVVATFAGGLARSL